MSYISWLTDRLGKLYHNGEAHVQEVLNVKTEIVAKAVTMAENDYAIFTKNCIEVADEIEQGLAMSTGFASSAGRIARMELAHVVEGLRSLAGLSGHEISAAKSSVPTTLEKVQTDMSVAPTNNVSDTTSNPLPFPATATATAAVEQMATEVPVAPAAPAAVEQPATTE